MAANQIDQHTTLNTKTGRKGQPGGKTVGCPAQNFKWVVSLQAKRYVVESGRVHKRTSILSCMCNISGISTFSLGPSVRCRKHRASEDEKPPCSTRHQVTWAYKKPLTLPPIKTEGEHPMRQGVDSCCR